MGPVTRPGTTYGTSRVAGEAQRPPSGGRHSAETPAAYAYFALRGVFDPAVLSDEIGIPADESARRGDPVLPGALLVHARDFWRVSSPLSPATDVEQHVESLVNRLEVATNVIQRLSREHEVGMFVAIYFTGAQGPPVRLTPKVAVWLGAVGAFLDLDYIRPVNPPNRG